MALLELKNLKTFFETKRGTVKAVNGVSYSLEAGQVLGVVGESGSGKSVSAMSILRLLDGNGYIDSGEILFDGIDLTKLSMNEMYKIRGNEISVIFQEPMTSLNPVFTVSRQISEPLMIHQGMRKREAAKKAVEPKMEVHFQFAGKDILAKSVLDQAVEAYKSTHKDVEIKEVELYIVAEEGAAYYVVNGEASDDFKVML